MLRVTTIQQFIKIKLEYFLDEYKFEYRFSNPTDWLWPFGLFICSNLLAYYFFPPKLMLAWLFIIMVTLGITGLQTIQTQKYNERYVQCQKTLQSSGMKRFWEGGYLDVLLDKNEEVLKSLDTNTSEKADDQNEQSNGGDFMQNGKRSKILGERTSKQAKWPKEENIQLDQRYSLTRSIKYSETVPGLRKSLNRPKVPEEKPRVEDILNERRDWYISNNFKLQVIPRPKGKEEPKLVILNQKVTPRQKIELEMKRKNEIENQRRKELEEKTKKEEEEKKRVAEELRKKQEEETLKRLKEDEIKRKADEEARKKLAEEEAARKKIEEEKRKKAEEEIKALPQPGRITGQPQLEEERPESVQVSKAESKIPVYSLKDDEYKKLVDKQSKEINSIQPFKLSPDQMEDAAKRIAGGYEIANPHNELRGFLNKMTNDPPALKKFACKILVLLKTYQLGTTEDSKKLFLSLIDQAVQRFMGRAKEVIETGPRGILSRVVVSHVIEIEVPGFIDTLIYHITSKIKLLIPEIVVRKPGMSDQEYKKELGYEYERDGTLESQENYENRVKGYSTLFFGLLTQDLRDTFVEVYDEPGDTIPGFKQMIFSGGKSYKWMYWKYIKMLLASPIQLMTPAVLTSWVRYSHFMLRKERDATSALLNIIRLKFFPKLKAFSDDVNRSTTYTVAEKLSCKNCTTELEGHLNEFARSKDIANWFERE